MKKSEARWEQMGAPCSSVESELLLYHIIITSSREVEVEIVIVREAKMPRLKAKKPRLLPSQMQNATSTVTDLSTDVIEMTFGHLPPIDIMRARVCRKWRQAARNTIVPLTEFIVVLPDTRQYNAMEAMTTSLSNLQQIVLQSLDYTRKNTSTTMERTHMKTKLSALPIILRNIGIVSNFTMLIHLAILGAPLNGRYPFLFKASHC
eukprot:scaffold33505_cov101-Skeletonema_dohrnii-CCMP3373.AAC.2